MESKVLECFKIAQERQAEELFLKANQEITLRVGRDLIPLNTVGGRGISMRDFVSGILNEEEKKELYENLKISGYKTLGAISFKFDLQIDFEGITGALTLAEQSGNHWSFPSIVIENLVKNFGLNILMGGRRSGKTSALIELLQKMPKMQKVIAIYTEDESVEYKCNGNIAFCFPMNHLEKNGVHTSADLIIFDAQDFRCVSRAVELSEMGFQVLLLLPFLNLELGLQRVVDLIDPDHREVSVRRLSSVLQMVLTTRLIKNIEGTRSGIFEIMINDSHIRPILLSQKWNLLNQTMKENSEKTGMRTLNQGLFQLMLKRKIDFRTAFEVSDDPEELDSLLKKIGI